MISPIPGKKRKPTGPKVIIDGISNKQKMFAGGNPNFDENTGKYKAMPVKNKYKAMPVKNKVLPKPPISMQPMVMVDDNKILRNMAITAKDLGKIKKYYGIK